MTTALTKLTFVKAPAKQGKDRVADRREKFIDGLEQQKRLLDDPGATVTARKRVTDEDGNVRMVDIQKPIRSCVEREGDVIRFTPRYGNRVLDFGSGNNAIEFKTDAELVKGIDLLIEAARAGDLDSAFDKALPKNFGKKASAAKPAK